MGRDRFSRMRRMKAAAEVAAEVGVVSRSGNRAYVDDAIHAMRCEQADELVDRPRGMTNRENARR